MGKSSTPTFVSRSKLQKDARKEDRNYEVAQDTAARNRVKSDGTPNNNKYKRAVANRYPNEDGILADL